MKDEKLRHHAGIIRAVKKGLFVRDFSWHVKGGKGGKASLCDTEDRPKSVETTRHPAKL
jgi:hypothetical protein